MRRPIIVGNWKMNKAPVEAQEFLTEFLPLVRKNDRDDIVLLPPLLTLPCVMDLIKSSNLMAGAQTMHWLAEGAFTGQVSPMMISSLGCKYVLLGHWECRSHLHENDQAINLKVKAAVEHKLRSILCVGETAVERMGGLTAPRLTEQVESALSGISAHNISEIIVAYEPIWAIGSGRSAKLEQIEEAHIIIRRTLERLLGQDIRQSASILYGGAVNVENAPFLMESDEVDGLLVGGASLDPRTFGLIVNYIEHPSLLHLEQRATK